MKINDLSHIEQNKICSYTKKYVRKYFKGLKNGSLKYNSFVETLFFCEEWESYKSLISNDLEFKNSIYSLIEDTLEIYDYNKSNYFYNSFFSDNNSSRYPLKNLSIKDRREFKSILSSSGYTLIFPIEFLTQRECNLIKEHILFDTPIPLGWQKVLTYIKKST